MLRRAHEKCLADLGYRGEGALINIPNLHHTPLIKKIKKDTGMRHKTVNKRLKQFGSLNQTFRHNLGHHKEVFKACIALLQMDIVGGEPL